MLGNSRMVRWCGRFDQRPYCFHWCSKLQRVIPSCWWVAVFRPFWWASALVISYGSGGFDCCLFRVSGGRRCFGLWRVVVVFWLGLGFGPGLDPLGLGLAH